MFTKLDLLYRLEGDNLDDLLIQFQMYKYDYSISFLKNISKLEYLKQENDTLEKTPMTESTFKACIINSLPLKRYHQGQPKSLW